jgi:hypothetical protein
VLANDRPGRRHDIASDLSASAIAEEPTSVVENVLHCESGSREIRTNVE